MLKARYTLNKNNSIHESAWVRCVGAKGPSSATVKKRKLTWVGHNTRHDNLSKTILQGTWGWGGGGRGVPWSAEEMLGGQRHRVDVPVHARTAHTEKTGRRFLLNRPSYPPLPPAPDDRINQGDERKRSDSHLYFPPYRAKVFDRVAGTDHLLTTKEEADALKRQAVIACDVARPKKGSSEELSDIPISPYPPSPPPPPIRLPSPEFPEVSFHQHTCGF